MTLLVPEMQTSGPVRLAGVLCPEGSHFLKKHYLSAALNPFLEPYEIRIAALTADGIPHIKTVPTWEMMFRDYTAGLYANMHTIVIPSSGNTAHAVVRLARAFGFTKVKVVMATDVPESKSGLLRAFGSLVDVMQVGNVAGVAREEAKKDGHYLLDQYSHEGNPLAHERHTGPEILRLTGTGLAGVSISLGSGGTAYGVGRFFRSKKLFDQMVKIIGVRPILGQQVPGARDEKKMEDVVQFPWRDKVDVVIEVGRKASFVNTRRLWSEVEPAPGPTSGLAYSGLLEYIHYLPPDKKEVCRGRTFAFLCPDDGRFYSAPILAELDPDQGVL